MFGFGAVALASLSRSGRSGARVLAAGWAADAVFDAAHTAGEDSIIPSWYPARCAGYDLVVAGNLLPAST